MNNEPDRDEEYFDSDSDDVTATPSAASLANA
jgi:hypothetical protein